VSEPDPHLPEVPHEGAPYQGYGPAPYQPPVPVPPPVPPGFAAPYQQAPPEQPPPPAVAPSVQHRPAVAASPDDGEVLQKWGYVMAISTLIVPILALVGLILGVLLAAKPHRQRHGITIIAVSIALGLLTVALWAGFYDEN
jgi:hypothetical protein